jgi:hypothetical protein
MELSSAPVRADFFGRIRANFIFSILSTLKIKNMKDSIKQFTLVIFAVVALSSIMGFAHPAADEPKQYILVIVTGIMTPAKMQEKLEKDVNAKIAEGWHLQGGIAVSGGGLLQAMVK